MPLTRSAAREAAAAALVILAGVLIAALPHAISWWRSGDSAWVADEDEVGLYLAVASRTYRDGSLRLHDPVPEGAGPTLYPALTLVPGIVAARALGLGPLGVALAWRVLAGATIALGWFAVLRLHAERWRACAASVLLVTDCGLIYGRPVVRQLFLAVRCLAGREGDLLATNPQIHTEWRLITPALSLAFLLLHVFCMERARGAGTRGRVLLAGASFGLLFHAYFYYWTAAALALGLVALLDRPRWRIHATVAAVGVLLGAPALLRPSETDWLERADLFVRIPHLAELLVPKVALATAALALPWALRQRSVLHLWTLAAAALLLENHQVVTGLQLQNFHWTYVWGPCLSALLVIAALAAPARVVACVLALHLAAGFGLRAVEATRTRETREKLEQLAHYREQRPAVAAGSLVAGDPAFRDWAVVLDGARPLDGYAVLLSASVRDAEWDERVALDAVLRGLDRAAFEREQRALLDANVWGPWARDPVARARRLASRLERHDAIRADLAAALARYPVRVVALPATASAPAVLAAWRAVARGPSWQVWERP